MEGSKIVQLRGLLKEQFPEAHADRPHGRDGKVVTGFSALDAIGLEKGVLCEAVVESRSLGGALLFTRVLRGLAEQGLYTVFIDGRDALDPQSLGREACRRLLWVRCVEAAQAIRAADLLLRDGNLPFVLMDLEWNPLRELGRVPSSSWFRLRTLIEKTSATLLVLTPTRLISSAHMRLQLASNFTADDLEEQEDKLTDKLSLMATRHLRDRVLTERTG